LVQTLGELLSAPFGHLTEGGNTLGAYLAGAIAKSEGKNAAQMLSGGLKAMILLNTEPDLDAADGAQALATLKETPFVVALATHKSQVSQYANVILPIAPFTETSGSFVNCEGRVQSFAAAVRPLGQTRPAWKVLRVLGNLMGLTGFDESSSEDVRKSLALDSVSAQLNNAVAIEISKPKATSASLTRVSNVPIYSTDGIVRRAASLQASPAAAKPVARMHTATAKALGLKDEQAVLARMNGHVGAQLKVLIDDSQAEAVVQISAAMPETVAVGPMFGAIEISAI